MTKNELRDYLADDNVMDMLKVIDRLNPEELPMSKLCTIKTVSVETGHPLKDIWKKCDEGVRAGVLMYCGGMLSKKRVDLTMLGVRILDAEGTEELRKIIKEYGR